MFGFCSPKNITNKTLMNRSALKSFGDGAFKNLLLWNIHRQKPAVAMSMSPCLHLLNFQQVSEQASQGTCPCEACRRWENTGIFTTKNALNFPHNLIFLGAGRLNWFCKCYWKPWIRNHVFFRAKGSCWQKWLQGFWQGLPITPNREIHGP